jgi:hypothetical protein
VHAQPSIVDETSFANLALVVAAQNLKLVKDWHKELVSQNVPHYQRKKTMLLVQFYCLQTVVDANGVEICYRTSLESDMSLQDESLDKRRPKDSLPLDP